MSKFSLLLLCQCPSFLENHMHRVLRIRRPNPILLRAIKLLKPNLLRELMFAMKMAILGVHLALCLTHLSNPRTKSCLLFMQLLCCYAELYT